MNILKQNTSELEIEVSNDQILSKKLKNNASDDDTKREQNAYETIQKILNRIGNFGACCYFSEASELPTTLGMYINNLGLLSIPVCFFQVDALKSVSHSPYDGVYEIDAHNLSIENPKWTHKMIILANLLIDKLGLSDEIMLCLESFIYMEQGASIPRQKCSTSNVIGYLYIQLPSNYTGGALVVSLGDSLISYNFCADSQASKFTCHYGAFLANCEYEFRPVTSGNRLLLVYSLSWSNVLNSNFIFSLDSKKVLRDTLIQLAAKKNVQMALQLDGPYKEASFNKCGVKAINIISDLHRFTYLNDINETLSDEHKYSFAIAGNSCTDTYIDHCTPHAINEQTIINTWFDSDGNDFSTKVYQVKLEFLSKLFVFDLNLEHSNTCNKFFLIFWPKRYEHSILIKLNLHSYIRSTYKEILCDFDANINTCEENLEFIVKELQSKDICFTLNYELMYNLVESIKFTQNYELLDTLLGTHVFLNTFRAEPHAYMIDFCYLLKEYNIQEHILRLLNDVRLFGDVMRNFDFLERLNEHDHKEFSFECFKKAILPSVDTYSKGEVYKNNYVNALRLKFCKHMFMFKNDLNNEWSWLRTYLTKFIDNARNDTLDYKLDLAHILFDAGEEEFSKTCVETNILPVLKDNIHKQIEYKQENLKFFVNLMALLVCKLNCFESHILSMITDILLNCQVPTIEKLCNDLKLKGSKVCKQESIIKIFKHLIDFYENQIKILPGLSWRIPNVVVRRKPDIQEFLRSDQNELIYKTHSITTLEDAKRNAKIFLKSSSSLDVQVLGRGMKAYVHVKKIRCPGAKYQTYKKYYGDKISALKKIIQSK